MITIASATIQREPLTSTIKAELYDLARENHTAAGNAEPFAPQWDAFANMESSGILHLTVARQDGVPVGYCAHVVAPHPFTGEQTATCLAIYVRPDHRGKVRGLLDHIERDLREAGVVAITYSVPHLSRAGSFFEAIGYECAELVMRKRIQP